jgi:large conductance mechanosensitive channel
MKKFFGEFKKFITRGNVLDMAVGVIVGGAFTAIVNGLSNFILKPIINYILALLLGKNTLSEIYTFLGDPAMKDVVDADGVVIGQEIDLANSFYIDWGAFINAIINFILIALVLFIIVRTINNLKDQNKKAFSDFEHGRICKEDRKAMKARKISMKDSAAVAAYFTEKAEAEAKAAAEAEEAARLEREANPTTEDLLKQIRDLLTAQTNA